MKIFLAATSLAPNYGGPAISVSRLALALADAGAEVGFWAADGSVTDTPFLPHKSRVRRLKGGFGAGLAEFGRVDVLHDNGIWRAHNHALARLAARRDIPRLVSTRGMLEPWAMAHKGWKKKLGWRLYQRRDLMLAGGHHATSDMEAENLRDLRMGVPVRIIPNGVDVPEHAEARQKGSVRTALFLGRIYPVKGLPMLIEAWARLRPKHWRLTIAGPDEAGHRAELEKLVKARNLGDCVSFPGAVAQADKASLFAGADLFVLPSHSESFGMAIGEALAHGVPVLTTTAAPWPHLEQEGHGWRVAPDMDAIAAGLSQALAQEPETLGAMGRKGRAWVAANFAWPQIAARFLTAYANLAG